jgi:hypothetical protein
MYIKKMVPECDFTGKKYDPPVMGAAAIARGHSGRWCEVMWMGPEYLAESGITPIYPEQAQQYIETNYASTDWCDF